MPDKKVTTPSPNLLQRLFGQGIQDPDIQASWEKMQREYPDRVNKTTHITEMGPLSKLINPGAYAVTNPLGMVGINTGLIKQDHADIDSVLAHELTHVNQVKSNGILKSIYNNVINSDSYEKDAYNEEEMRRKRMAGYGKDVYLPYEKIGK